ncbi:MAG: DUF5915 domain-containing protein, partial [Myxococcota bacterium]|nr:DUF5915 domain-containing protein [Myxococcota bacterium]
VHMMPYPAVDDAQIDDALEAQIDCVIRTKNLGLNLRNGAQVKVRQPLGDLTVRPASEADRAVLADAHFAAQVLEECNVKALTLIEDEGTLATVTLKANFKALGPRYGKQMKAIAAHIAQADAGAVSDGIAGEGYAFDVDGEEVLLVSGDVQVAYEGPENLAFGAEGGAFAALNVEITPALAAEGIARDFNRLAQDQRREMDLEVSDRILVTYVASDRIAGAIAAHGDYLSDELLADDLRRADSLEGGGHGKVAGEAVQVSVARSS